MPPVQSFNTQDGASVTHSDDQHEPIDPLTIGELRPLKELAEEFNLSYHSLRTYAKSGRLRATKFGMQWATTRAAVEAYLASRYIRHKPDENDT